MHMQHCFSPMHLLARFDHSWTVRNLIIILLYMMLSMYDQTVDLEWHAICILGSEPFIKLQLIQSAFTLVVSNVIWYVFSEMLDMSCFLVLYFDIGCELHCCIETLLSCVVDVVKANQHFSLLCSQSAHCSIVSPSTSHTGDTSQFLLFDHIILLNIDNRRTRIHIEITHLRVGVFTVSLQSCRR